MPFFSIITVTYNAECFIETSMLSVLEQSFSNFEYIIIDGNSTDQTLNIIKRHLTNFTYLISEKDNGIYDAMNKGLKISKGDYIFFLGADDKFYDRFVLQNIAHILMKDQYDFVVGDIMYDTGKKFISTFGFKTLLNNTIHHQGIFYKHELFKLFRYDNKLRIIADYELNLLLYLKRKELKYYLGNNLISVCTDAGVSRTQLDLAYKETNEIRKKILKRQAGFLKMIYTIKFYITNHVI